jgi:hypothetical protein
VSGSWQAFFKEYDTLFPPTDHVPAIEETGVLGLLCPTYFRSACTTDGNDRWFSKPPPDDTHLPNLPLNADGPRLPPHGRLHDLRSNTDPPKYGRDRSSDQSEEAQNRSTSARSALYDG